MRLARKLRLGWLCVACALVLGCNGSIGDSDTSGTSGPLRCRDGETDPGPTYLRRLTNNEYDRTVRALTLEEANLSTELEFPPDTKVHGFDNNAQVMTTSTLHAQRYGEAAERISRGVIANEARRTAVFGCELVGDDGTCLREFIRSFGRRAFRRPLTEGPDSEVERLAALSELAADDDNAYAPGALVLEAILQSPDFLFRPEEGVESDRDGLARLTGFEIVTRLAFFFTGRPPSAALLDRAADGELDDADGVEALAREMLETPEAVEAVRQFYAAWLRLDNLDDVSRSTSEYALWSDSLRDDMREETQRFMDDLIWSDTKSFLEVYTSRSTFVNGELATLYGLDDSNDAWHAVEFPAGVERSGVLTQASFLTVTGVPGGRTVIRRGSYIREMLMCDPLPPPPAGVPQFPAPMPGETEREQLARHRTDPYCATCHVKLDPLGFGLERFDEIGGFRETDRSGATLAADGYIDGMEASSFAGAVELGGLLRESEYASSCVVTQVLRFALGREISDQDGCLVRQLETQFRASGESFKELLVSIARSDAFRYRRQQGGGS